MLTFKKILLALLGLLGTIIALSFTTTHGVGLTPDSVVYISVARNLTEGNGFINYNGIPLTLQPPLYPLLLALVRILLFVDPITSSSYINSFLFGFTIFLSGLILLNLLKSFTLVLLGSISILLSFVIVQFTFMALTELLFITLLLLSFYFYEKYQQDNSLFYYILFSIAAALAFLTRYTGIIIIVTFITLSHSRWFASKKKTYTHWLVVISIMPVAIWILRNYLLTGTLAGQRGGSSFSLFQNISNYITTVFLWIAPLNSIGVFIVGFGIVIFIYAILTLISLQDKSLKKIKHYFLFITLYSAFIVISSTTTAYDVISNRLLSPIYIPGIIVLFFTFDSLICRPIILLQQKIALVLFIVLMVVSVTYSAQKSVIFIKEYAKNSGSVFNSQAWRKSETIEYLSSNMKLFKNHTLYCNEPEAVYILTKLIAERSPAKTYYNSPNHYYANSNKVDHILKERTVYLIWFNKFDRSFLFSVKELKKNNNIVKIAHFNDGEIYTLPSP